MEGSKAARLAIISGSSSGVRHKGDGFPDQTTVRAARKLELGMSPPANSPHESMKTNIDRS